MTRAELKGARAALRRAEWATLRLDRLKRCEAADGRTDAACRELEAEIAAAMARYEQAAGFIRSVEDERIRTIASMRFLDGLRWRQVADALGETGSESGVRMALVRYLDRRLGTPPAG